MITEESKDFICPQIWMKMRCGVVRLQKVLDWQNFHFTLLPHRRVVLQAGLFVGFCDFAFSSGQNDRVGIVLGRVKVLFQSDQA